MVMEKRYYCNHDVNFVFKNKEAYFQIDESDLFKIQMVEIRENENGGIGSYTFMSGNNFLTIFIQDHMESYVYECNCMINNIDILSNDLLEFHEFDKLIDYLELLEVPFFEAYLLNCESILDEL